MSRRRQLYVDELAGKLRAGESMSRFQMNRWLVRRETPIADFTPAERIARGIDRERAEKARAKRKRCCFCGGRCAAALAGARRFEHMWACRRAWAAKRTGEGVAA